MTRRAGILALVGLALSIGLAAFLHYFEWEEREINLPPRGEASYNPLFALATTLRARGHDVQVRPTLELEEMALAPGELLLLASDVRVLGDETSTALRDWVAAGGRLVFELPPSEPARTPPLLAALGLQLLESAGCLEWQAPQATRKARLCGPSGLENAVDARPRRWGWSDAQGVTRMAQGERGAGTWLALPQIDFLARRALRNRSNATLAWALLQPLLGAGRVHVVYAVDLPPLHVLLVRHGWPVWVPALLALLAWLWRRSQRFGPLLPLATPDRRALLEHLRAAGEFALRRRRGGALYAALRRRFEARLQREAPALAALQGEAQVVALAAAWRIDPARVRAALQPPDLARPEAFAGAIRSLSQLQAPR
jgi:hypothetical protein